MVKYTKPTILQFTLKHCMIWKHFYVRAQILDRETNNPQTFVKAIDKAVTTEIPTSAVKD